MNPSVNELIALWGSLFPDYTPPRTQFVLWFEINGYDITKAGIIATGKKFVKMNYQMTPEHLQRFASSCMNRARQEREDMYIGKGSQK